MSLLDPPKDGEWVKLRLIRKDGKINRCDFLFRKVVVPPDLMAYIQYKGWDKEKRGSNLVYDMQIDVKGRLIVSLRNGYFNSRPFNKASSMRKVYTALNNKFWKAAQHEDYPFDEEHVAQFMLCQQMGRDPRMAQGLFGKTKSLQKDSFKAIKQAYTTNYDLVWNFRTPFIECLNYLNEKSFELRRDEKVNA